MSPTVPCLPSPAGTALWSPCVWMMAGPSCWVLIHSLPHSPSTDMLSRLFCLEICCTAVCPHCWHVFTSWQPVTQCTWQFYRLFGNTLSCQVLTQSFSLPMMEHWSKESDFYLHSFHTTRALQTILATSSYFLCHRSITKFGSEAHNTSAFAFNICYVEKRSIFVSACLRWKLSQRRPRWPDSKLNRRNRQLCLWNDVLDGLRDFDKSWWGPQTDRQTDGFVFTADSRLA